MTARLHMPRYATEKAFVVSGEQLSKIIRNRNPFKEEPPRYNYIRKQASYRITKLKDETWWVENYRDGAPLFAPDYWHQISITAGKRAKRLKDFVQNL